MRTDASSAMERLHSDDLCVGDSTREVAAAKGATQDARDQDEVLAVGIIADDFDDDEASRHRYSEDDQRTSRDGESLNSHDLNEESFDIGGSSPVATFRQAKKGALVPLITAATDTDKFLFNGDQGRTDGEQSPDRLAAFSDMPSIEGISGQIEGPPQLAGSGHCYQALPANCIRLLRITPCTPGFIRCEMQNFALGSGVDYTALSYTWGKGPDTDRIFVNNYQMRVRRNLWRFLNEARKVLSENFDWFWIDALCINQHDNLERSNQVNIMAQIYQTASSVLVWLGPSYGGSEEAFDYLIRKKPHGSRKAFSSINFGKSASIHVAALCYRPYWRRLWILQEIVLAKRIWMMCGDRLSPWQPFREILLRAREYEDDLTFALPKHSRLEGGLELTSMSKGPAMAIFTLTERHSRGQSLRDLLLETSFLRCADPLDKIYALLSIADKGCGDIQPDYDIALTDLLHVVLRNYHESRHPRRLKTVINQCHALEAMFDLEPDALLTTNGTLDTHTGVTSSNDAVAHFGRPGSPITWWWVSLHGHTQLETLFWREFAPYSRDFYYEAAEAGDLHALQILLDRAQVEGMFRQDHERPKACQTHVAQIDAVRLLSPGVVPESTLAATAPTSELATSLYSVEHKILSQIMRGAISGGNFTLVKVLVKAGAELNAQEGLQHCYLGVAARYGHLDIVKLLLDNGADVNGRELQKMGFGVNDLAYRYLPLIHAAGDGHLEVAKLLLRQGAEDPEQFAPYYASTGGHLELLKFLMQDFDAKGEALDGNGSFPPGLVQTLQKSCEEGRLDTVQLLLESRTFKLLQGSSGNPILGDAMHAAAVKKHWDVVRLLLDSGADANFSHKGLTILHLAAHHGDSPDVVEMLLEKGANAHLPVNQAELESWGQEGWLYVSEEPMTALEIAQEYSHTDIEQVILAHIQAHPVEGTVLWNNYVRDETRPTLQDSELEARCHRETDNDAGKKPSVLSRAGAKAHRLTSRLASRLKRK